MSDKAFKSASELARMVQSKELSARELLDCYLERIEAHNPALNAIVTMDIDAARGHADEADRALAAGEIWGPLHGLPMTIKDAFEVKGMRSSAGAAELKDHVPEADADVVARLRGAGANIFGKTNVPLYSGDWQSYNDVYGRTNNPFDLERTPGGSSGGAAAALSAGLVAAEIGSDIGGSIRVPASFCGLFGHKPSFGLVPQRGHIPPPPGALGAADLAVTGPLGRSVADLKLMLGLMAGPGESEKAIKLSLPLARSSMRVAVWTDDPFAPVDSEVSASVVQAGEALRGVGFEVDFDARPNVSFEASHAIYLTILSSIISDRWPEKTLSYLQEHAAKAPEDATDDLTLQARGSVLSYNEYLGLNSWREALKAEWANFFETYNALICPVTSVPAFPHDTERCVPERKTLVNGEERPYTELLRWVGLATLCHLPATSAPVGLSAGGLPLGVQIVGPYQEDLSGLAVAEVLEKELGGFQAPKLD